MPSLHAKSGRVAAIAGLALLLIASVAVAVFVATRRPAEPVVEVASASQEAPSIESQDETSPSPFPVGADQSRAVVETAAAPSAEDSIAITVAARTQLMFGEGGGVSRVAVELGLGPSFDPTTQALARAVTDDRGSARVEVPWSAIEQARALRQTLWARVVEPGYARRTRTVRLPANRDPFEVRLLAVRGASVVGRILDAAGTPVSGKVRARAWNANGDLAFAGQGDADSDGWWELVPFQPGTYDLVADAGERGTGVRRGVSLQGSLADPIEIRVEGAGLVRGRVRDARGVAAGALELAVHLAALDDERGSTIFPMPLAGNLELEGRGRTWTNATTDVGGRFAIAGLRLDRYVVRARTKSGMGEGYPHLLTRSPVASDGVELDLVFERPYLAVRLVDERGGPWKGPVSSARATTRGKPDDWPRVATLLVVPSIASLDPAEQERPFVAGRSAGDEHAFDVRDGRTYLVGVIGGGQVWSPREVEVPLGAGRVEVELQVRSHAPHGWLTVSARDAAGGERTQALALRIEDPATGVALLGGGRDEARLESWPRRIELPVGSYRVLVSAPATGDFFHGVVFKRADLGCFESVVDVAAGAETRVEAVLGSGARIALRCVGKIEEQDRVALRATHPGATFGGGIDLFAGRVELRLHRDGRWPLVPSFPFVITGSSAAGLHLGSFVELGSEAVSEPLPAGRFLLEGHLPGGRVIQREIELVEGRTSEVVLDFE